jgi:hypothetical protein
MAPIVIALFCRNMIRNTLDQRQSINDLEQLPFIRPLQPITRDVHVMSL